MHAPGAEVEGWAMKARKRHWYHCTEERRGPEWMAQRIPPQMIGESEPRTPRLCVCHSVAACFSARLFSRTVYIYRTATKRSGIRPCDVWDAPITGERWLVPPVKMVLIGTVSHYAARRISGPTVKHIRAHESVSWQVRIADLERAIEVLGEIDPTYVCRRDRRIIDLAQRWLSGVAA